MMNRLRKQDRNIRIILKKPISLTVHTASGATRRCKETNLIWIESGLNIILGLPADKVATIKQSTYLPDYLMYALKDANIKNIDQLRGIITANDITTCLARKTQLMSEVT